jgi:hypothetical protein
VLPLHNCGSFVVPIYTDMRVLCASVEDMQGVCKFLRTCGSFVLRFGALDRRVSLPFSFVLPWGILTGRGTRLQRTIR